MHVGVVIPPTPARAILPWKDGMGPRDAAVISKGESLSLSALRILDARLSSRTFLAGDVFSMGDIPAAATVHRWYALDIHHPDLPNVLRWYDLMRARPPFQRIVVTPLS